MDDLTWQLELALALEQEEVDLRNLGSTHLLSYEGLITNVMIAMLMIESIIMQKKRRKRVLVSKEDLPQPDNHGQAPLVCSL